MSKVHVDALVIHTENDGRTSLEFTTRPAPCCMRRARARYWRIARGYLACGMVLGLALGMVLGTASKVCP